METDQQAAAYAAARPGDDRVVQMFGNGMPCQAYIEGGFVCSRRENHAPTGHVAEAGDMVVAVSR